MITRRLVIGGLALTPAVAARAAPLDGQALLTAARRQIGVTTAYDTAYRQLNYPGGDVPLSTGVCCDVVVRAARAAWGLDLQRLVHEDMARAFSAYPRRWGLTHPDANIDHRRVPNLAVFWDRQGARVSRAGSPGWSAHLFGGLQPGDILTWRSFGGAGPHVAIVASGGLLPSVVHNYGWGAHEDVMFPQWLATVDAHYRWRPVRAGAG